MHFLGFVVTIYSDPNVNISLEKSNKTGCNAKLRFWQICLSKLTKNLTFDNFNGDFQLWKHCTCTIFYSFLFDSIKHYENKNNLFEYSEEDLQNLNFNFISDSCESFLQIENTTLKRFYVENFLIMQKCQNISTVTKT